MFDLLTELEKYLKYQKEISKGLLYLDTKDIDIDLEQNSHEEINMQTTINSQDDNVDPDWMNSKNINQLNSKINSCLKCKLGSTRTNFVFGTGNPNADIMVIGEAPGKDEDLKGEPFVGRAGQLLTKILQAIDLQRKDVFIANIIKCRPPNNRRPEKDEVDSCMPYLKKQIDLIKPKFIMALGLTAVDTLLNKKHKMGDIRGQLFDYYNTKMLVTYHPAALLRNPNWKKATWEDVKLLRKLYNEYLSNKEDNK
jgi:DNA polymerase